MLRVITRPPACAAVASVLVLATACAGDPDRAGPSLPMEEDIYVEILARLDLIRTRNYPAEQAGARDSVADSARTALLSDYDVAPEQLLSFAEIVGEDPATMEILSARIATLADSLRKEEMAAARDSAAAGGDSAAAGSDSAVAGGDSAAAVQGPPTGDGRRADAEERAAGPDSIPAADGTERTEAASGADSAAAAGDGRPVPGAAGAPLRAPDSAGAARPDLPARFPKELPPRVRSRPRTPPDST
jgi:hypothetical protein